MSSFVEVVQALLGDNRVKVLIALLGVVAVAMPLIRYFHDRAQTKLHRRQVVALESIASSLRKKKRRMKGQ